MADLKLKKYQLILLSLAGGTILTLSWPVKGIAPLLFIGFIPFFFIEEFIFRQKERFSKVAVFFYVYPGFLLWNVLTTWWIWNSTDVGSILAFILNAMFMSAMFHFYHLTRRHLPPGRGPLILIFFWITFEFIHHRWDITWPWLTLGNGFAAYHKWIQWYEYTGVFGGTLWILLVNVLLYRTLMNLLDKKGVTSYIFPLVSGILLAVVPALVSLSIYRHYEERPWPVDVVVVQPNVDPYNEQYELAPAELLQRNLDLASEKMDSLVDFVVCPESAIQEGIWEERIDQSYSVRMLRKFTDAWPRTGVIIGASTFREFREGEPISVTARKFRDADQYYDAFNTAFYITRDEEVAIHHKSKLTPGVEKMPFPKIMKPLEKMAINLGGTVGSLGVDKERTVFTRQSDGLKIAPVICYESVYGEYITQYIRKGANLIFVVTNDGWWGDTPGHRQHFTFSVLRAIETRRSVARSANTGTSAFINQRGDAFQMTDYWVPAVIRQKINANDEITFYVRYGDYIARLSAFVSVFLILIAISRKLMKR